MKNQALFSLKDNFSKKLKCCLLQFLFGALRVNLQTMTNNKKICRSAVSCLSTTHNAPTIHVSSSTTKTVAVLKWQGP